MPDPCITLRLTPEQQDAIRTRTGLDGDALVLPLEELDGHLADAADAGAPDADAIVWECLNPYP